MSVEPGFFVDWNGNARRTEDAGGDFRVEVDMVARYVALYSKGGSLMHEATYYKTLEAMEKKGIKAPLVDGSTPWGMKNEW
ncbi:hypothetical protein [Methyloterricola oryzae]|uniref:hypothetical protein n=1 Tax=Methyloterricola oryzae TaxID=1495050 RepID=UPI0005EBBAAF|nr:hypothetical protein [Methyloterricola oryzae]